VRAGQHDCKYELSASLWDLKADGHASDVNKIGQWCVFGGHEFFNAGPTYADLNAAVGIIHVTLNGQHYNTPVFSIVTNQSWQKFYGPFLLYCNTNYPPAAARGAVSGQFVISDPLKPLVNSSNAWIGLVGPTTGDPYPGWQFQGSKYQYWAQLMRELPMFLDTLVNFKIPASLLSGRFGVRHFQHPT